MKHILSVSSPDAQGLIAKISSILFKHQLNIEKNDEHVDEEYGQFFMRTCFSGEADFQAILQEIRTQLPTSAEVKISHTARKSIVILCTKENHCLGDLLLRHESGELDVEIKAVVSNHAILEPLSQKFGVPFFHIDAEGISREAHEEKMLQCLKSLNPDLLVLAKYMRILSPHFVEQFQEKMINIHHSFLPAFVGANPYKQAYERGVKIIGATAHFVTQLLDEGPIIFQDIVRIDHTYSWQEMQKAGRNVEKIVLARALDLVLKDRIFIFQNKTIVF
ncbi:formyltetrahydrofolate deformylase [Helicobacter enhydrae]|uniref:Formyltetrahydrofolate deformylase n=1 Tax=Helicobacter enhydrae TaxID=222136 RepID=A0A1B1U6V4_9HELI|nr:formyltetrahydrofolate deformylase [Helicobacter enhydrae]ANV98466.1 formyltetrahydrofolate deformylase [Helicobacter enhydrae]